MMKTLAILSAAILTLYLLYAAAAWWGFRVLGHPELRPEHRRALDEGQLGL